MVIIAITPPSCANAPARVSRSMEAPIVGLSGNDFKVVLRGLDPRIHVFRSTVPSAINRMWPGRPCSSGGKPLGATNWPIGLKAKEFVLILYGFYIGECTELCSCLT